MVAESRLSELPTEKPKQVVTNGPSDDPKHSNPKAKGSSGGKSKGEVELEVVEKIVGASLVGKK